MLILAPGVTRCQKMSLVLPSGDPYNAPKFRPLNPRGAQNVLLRGDFWKRPTTLKPYVLKVKEGFLLGLAMDPEKGAPCANCVFLWRSEEHTSNSSHAITSRMPSSA